MSFQAVHWALHEVQGVPNKLVLVVLAEYADEHGCCWPSQQAISRAAELSESTVRRVLRTYEQMGLISSTHRYIVNEDGAKHRASNVYQLNIGAQPQAVAKTPAPPSAKAQEPVDNSGEGLPVKLTGRGQPVDNPPVDNSGEPGAFGFNPYTGQSDRKVGATGQIQGATGHQVTGITTIQTTIKNHQTSAGVREQRESELDEPGQVGSGPEDAPSDLASLQAVEVVAPERAEPASGSDTADDASPVQASESSPGVGQRPEGGGLTAADAELLAACLPAWMRPMDAPGAAGVLALLRERLEAGWTPSGIAQALDAPPPVGGARRLSALVAYRIRDNVSPHLAPRPASRPSVVEQDQREAERRARADALAVPTTRTDPAFARALDQVRRHDPTLSLLEASRLARELMNQPPPRTQAGAPGPPAAA